MGKRNRFRKPGIERLLLSDGDWVEVKRRLSVGEERAAFQAIVGQINQDGWRKPNVELVGIAEMFAYLVDWSFTGDDDKPVKLTIDAIQNLDPDDYKELEDALDAHKKRMEAEREAQKNARGGASESSSISPSVVG